MSSANSETPPITQNGGAWRMIAYAGLAGSLLLNTQAPPIVVGVYAAACFVAAVFAYARSVRERNGDRDPSWMKSAPVDPEERREFGSLAKSPFVSKNPYATLHERITGAAELCVQYGRRTVVLSLRFDAVDRDELEKVADIVRQVVRKTDLVEIVSDEEIIVGLAMVRDFSPASLVTERLQKKLGALTRLSNVGVSSGSAIYPLHGYTGEELIQSARESARLWPARQAA